jgi:translation initiation factor 1A
MKKKLSQEEIEIAKIRIPKGNEVLGVVESLVGGDKAMVKCDDGKNRICRIPGRLRKRVWISPGDVILVEPWKVETEKKGDIVFKYTPTQVSWLKKKGYGKNLTI